MKKISAWTLVELMVVLSLIAVISGAMVSVFKPKTQGYKIFLYATINNIQTGASAVIEKYATGGTSSREQAAYQRDGETINDTFCMEIADVFTLKNAANCLKSAADSVANVTFTNEVQIYGLASEWLRPDANAKFYKNIMIDVNGAEKGPNKLGIDRFPFRLYSDAALIPVNCGETEMSLPFKSGVQPVVSMEGNEACFTLTDGSNKNKPCVSPYCKAKGFEGAQTTKNFMLEDNLISYDIYQFDEKQLSSKGKLVKSTQNFLIADCTAHGGMGIVGMKECANAQGGPYLVSSKCATEAICTACATGSGDEKSVCPYIDGSTAQTDEATCKCQVKGRDNGTGTCVETEGALERTLSCDLFLHKPAAGISLFVESIVGDISSGT